MTPHWTFLVSGEYVNISSSLTGEVYYLLKRHIHFKPINDTIFEIGTLGNNFTKRINRLESVTPVSGLDIVSYLDSLSTLLSA